MATPAESTTTETEPTRTLRRTALLVAALAAYAGVGLFIEWKLLQRKPYPGFLIEDFTYYARAFRDALHSGDPYLVRSIGQAFIYPPQALILLLPAFAAQVVSPFTIVALNVALAIALPLLVARLFRLPLRRVWWWPALALFFGPTLEQIYVGQVNLIVAVALVLVLHRRTAVSAAGFAVATLVKFTPVVFLAYLVAGRRWKTVGVAVLWAAIPTAAVGIWLGPRVFVTFADVITHLLGGNQPSELSASGRIQAVLGLQPDQALWVQWVLILWAGTALAASTVMAWRTKDSLPTFLIAGFLMPVVPSIVWYHHFTFLLVPVFVWMASAGRRNVALWCLVGLAAIQLDPTRVAAHVFAHASVAALLAVQAGAFQRARTATPAPAALRPVPAR